MLERESKDFFWAKSYCIHLYVEIVKKYATERGHTKPGGCIMYDLSDVRHASMTSHLKSWSGCAKYVQSNSNVAVFFVCVWTLLKLFYTTLQVVVNYNVNLIQMHIYLYARIYKFTLLMYMYIKEN